MHLCALNEKFTLVVKAEISKIVYEYNRGSTAIPSPLKTTTPLKTTKKSFLPAPSTQNSKSVLEKLRPHQLLQPPPLREVRKGLGKRTSSSSGFSSAR